MARPWIGIVLVRRAEADTLFRRLAAMNVFGVIMSPVVGGGAVMDAFSRDRASEYTRFELVFDQSQTEAITQAVAELAHANRPGAGWVATLPLRALYDIRRRADATREPG